MAQTAVEWFYQRILAKDIKDVFEQAKVIERDNIMKAFSDGQETPISSPTLPHYSSNEYYNEKYLSNKTDK
jgi:hypothetical protein